MRIDICEPEKTKGANSSLLCIYACRFIFSFSAMKPRMNRLDNITAMPIGMDITSIPKNFFSIIPLRIVKKNVMISDSAAAWMNSINRVLTFFIWLSIKIVRRFR